MADIRCGTLEIAEQLAITHVVAWKETYTGLLPSQVICEMSEAKRVSQWRKILSDPSRYGVFVAMEDGQIEGFGTCLRQERMLEGLKFSSEIMALYVLKRSQRKGIGTMLTRYLITQLLQGGCRDTFLWVLRKNENACAFYRRLGAQMMGGRRLDMCGTMMDEVLYAWNDINVLLTMEFGRTD